MIYKLRKMKSILKQTLSQAENGKRNFLKINTSNFNFSNKQEMPYISSGESENETFTINSGDFERFYDLGKNANVQRFASGEKLIFKVERKDFFKNIDDIKENLGKLLEVGRDVNLVIEGVGKSFTGKDDQIEYTYTKEEIQKICEVNDYLKSKGMRDDIRFCEFYGFWVEEQLKECWTVESVLKANNEIKKVVEDIKSKNLSPYEKMLYIHKYVSSRFSYSDKVRRERGSRSGEDTRNIVYAYEFDKICCSGFASVVKAIIDELDDPNLKCEFSVIKSDKEGHAFNTIEIKDEKYEIDGSYREDACWDCKNENFEEGTFAFCMQPIAELDHLQTELRFKKSYLFDRVDSGVRLPGAAGEGYWTKKSKGNSEKIPVDKTMEALDVVLKAENPDMSDEERKQAILKMRDASISCAMGKLKKHSKISNSFLYEGIEGNKDEDKEFILKAVKMGYDGVVSNISGELLKDYDFLIELINTNPYSAFCLPKDIFSNEQFREKLMKLDFLNDKEIVMNLAGCVGLFDVSPLSKDKDFRLEIFQERGVLNLYDWELTDYDFLTKIIMIDSTAFNSKHLAEARKSKEFLAKVYSVRPRLVDKKMLKDKEFCLQILSENSGFWFDIDPKLKKNIKFVLDATRINPEIIGYLPEEIKNDKKFIAEVRGFASMQNREFVYDMIYNKGIAECLKFSSFRNDKDFVSEVVRVTPMSLKYTDLKNDPVFLAGLLWEYPYLLDITGLEIDKKILEEVNSIIEQKQKEYDEQNPKATRMAKRANKKQVENPEEKNIDDEWD